MVAAATQTVPVWVAQVAEETGTCTVYPTPRPERQTQVVVEVPDFSEVAVVQEVAVPMAAAAADLLVQY